MNYHLPPHWETSREEIDGGETDDDDVSSYGENFRSFFSKLCSNASTKAIYKREDFFKCINLLELISLVKKPGNFTNETDKICAVILSDLGIKKCKEIIPFSGVKGVFFFFSELESNVNLKTHTDAFNFATSELQLDEKVIGIYTPIRRTKNYRWAEDIPVLVVLMKGEDSLDTGKEGGIKATKTTFEFSGEPKLIKGTHVLKRYGKKRKCVQ